MRSGPKVAIDFALGYYPHERALRESADVLDEVIFSLNSSDTNGATARRPGTWTFGPLTTVTSRRKRRNRFGRKNEIVRCSGYGRDPLLDGRVGPRLILK
jgi:hypothetical protein